MFSRLADMSWETVSLLKATLAMAGIFLLVLLYFKDRLNDEAYDRCLAESQQFGWYNRSTAYNPFTREGKKSVSLEICEQMEWNVPDLVVVPVGDGNMISGVWKGFEDLFRIGFIDRRPRLLAVQAEGSAAVVQAIDGDGEIRPVSGCTIADSISVSIPRDGEAASLIAGRNRAADGLLSCVDSGMAWPKGP